MYFHFSHPQCSRTLYEYFYKKHFHFLHLKPSEFFENTTPLVVRKMKVLIYSKKLKHLGFNKNMQKLDNTSNDRKNLRLY